MREMKLGVLLAATCFAIEHEAIPSFLPELTYFVSVDSSTYCIVQYYIWLVRGVTFSVRRTP